MPGGPQTWGTEARAIHEKSVGSSLGDPDGFTYPYGGRGDKRRRRKRQRNRLRQPTLSDNGCKGNVGQGGRTPRRTEKSIFIEFNDDIPVARCIGLAMTSQNLSSQMFELGQKSGGLRQVPLKSLNGLASVNQGGDPEKGFPQIDLGRFKPL